MNAVRDAIYDRLAAAITWDGNAVSVHDAIPQDAPKPYIALMESSVESMNTDTSLGARVRTRIVVDSGYEGSKEAASIAGLVRARLDRCTLTITGATFMDCLATTGGSETDSDLTTRRATVDCEVLVDDITSP